MRIDTTIEDMAAELVERRRVIIRGFGTFTVKDTPARVGRNPKTGETAPIPAGKRVAFRPSPAFKEVLAKSAAEQGGA